MGHGCLLYGRLVIWCTGMKNVFPAISGTNGLRQDVQVFFLVHDVFVGKGALRMKRQGITAAFQRIAHRQYPTVCLTGISECFSFCIVNVEQGVACACFWQADGATPAVVKDMCCLVHQIVCEGVIAWLFEVVKAEVATGFLAESNNRRSVRRQGVSPALQQIHIGQIPNSVQPGEVRKTLSMFSGVKKMTDVSSAFMTIARSTSGNSPLTIGCTLARVSSTRFSMGGVGN